MPRPEGTTDSAETATSREPILDGDGRKAYNVVLISMADTLGAFEQAVLLAIVRLREDAYGRAILKEVAVRLARDVAAGAVHATLERLETKRLIASHLGSGTPVRAGRARRFYRPQPSGLRALNDSRAAVDSLWHGLKWPLKGSI
jgi:PadR family transcriptional regulator PadR